MRAQGQKHELEVFRTKLSVVSLFLASSARILSRSLELAPLNYIHRLMVSVCRPPHTCVCVWIKF